jgi:hypothetical protein
MTMALTEEDISIIFGILDIMSYEAIKNINPSRISFLSDIGNGNFKTLSIFRWQLLSMEY